MDLIRRFDPWNNPQCTCPAKYSLSPYTGCGHACLYCYASSYIPHFSHPRPKVNFKERLTKEVKKLPHASYISMANSSDPYQPLEKKTSSMREALKILLTIDPKIMLVTKSSLIIRDIDIIKDFSSLVVAVSLTTLDSAIAKKLEPHASGPRERIKTIRRLCRYIPVIARIDPLIYPLTTPGIKKIVQAAAAAGSSQIVTSTYKVKLDNFKRMIRAFPRYKMIWKNLYYRRGIKIGGSLCLDETMRKTLIETVKAYTQKEGLKFSSCREGFGALNTAACDGSSFLR